MHGHALAPGDEADNLFAANRITAVRAVHQQVVVSSDFNGRVVAAEDPADDAGQAACPVAIAVRWAPVRLSAPLPSGSTLARMLRAENFP